MCAPIDTEETTDGVGGLGEGGEAYLFLQCIPELVFVVSVFESASVEQSTHVIHRYTRRLQRSKGTQRNEQNQI